MSALYLNLYAKPADEAALARLKEFAGYVQAGDHAAIERMDSAEVLYDIEDAFSTDMSSSVGDGVMYMCFDLPSSYEVELLVEFLHNLGAENVEITVFCSQVGEYFFHKNEEYFDNYDDAEWSWLINPQSGLADEHVVVTGIFEDYDRKAVEALVVRHGGNVQQSVNSKTTLLVVGQKPGKSKLDKAEELGVRQITEEEFMELIG